jgi:hypothetical protein
VACIAVFTLLANFEVWRGGSLHSLSLLCALAAFTAAAALAVRRIATRRRSAQPRSGGQSEAGAGPADPYPASALPGALTIGLIAASLLALALRWLTGSLAAWWVVALAASAIMLWLFARRPIGLPQPRSVRAHELLLAGLALLCAIAVSTAHRGDADDAFYVNLVVAAVDQPEAPLLAGDTLHGYDDVPMSLPVFKVLSHELLQAVIASATGARALTIVHVVLPPLLALLIPLAYARLLRRLLPGRWLWAVAIVVAQLCLVGDGRAGFGDFALLRLHQGKSVLLHVLMPLLACYGIEFALRPSRSGWLRLAAAQIAALGLSSSGLWLGPAAAGIGLASGLSLADRQATLASARRLALGLLASAYPVALALSLRAATLRAFRDAPHPLESLSWTGDALMKHALEWVLGTGPYQWLALFSLIAVHAVFAPGLFRRYAAISICLFLLLWNPLTAPTVAHHLTGADTYFRVFWLLPLPLLVAAWVTDPIERLHGHAPGVRRAALGALAAAMAVLLWLGPAPHTLSTANGVRLARPGWKLPPVELAAAERIADHAARGELVLAPARISRWLPLIHRHPSPLMVREMHLDLLHERLGAAELNRRATLTHMAGGTIRPEAGGRLLGEAIDGYPLQVVCLAGRALAWPELRGALKQSALEVRYRDADYEIWARRGEPIPGRR